MRTEAVSVPATDTGSGPHRMGRGDRGGSSSVLGNAFREDGSGRVGGTGQWKWAGAWLVQVVGAEKRKVQKDQEASSR